MLRETLPDSINQRSVWLKFALLSSALTFAYHFPISLLLVGVSAAAYHARGRSNTTADLPSPAPRTTHVSAPAQIQPPANEEPRPLRLFGHYRTRSAPPGAIKFKLHKSR